MRKLLKDDSVNPISIHITNDPSILDDDTHNFIDLEFSPWVKDFHPTFGDTEASIVGVTYVDRQAEWSHIEKVTWSKDEAEEIKKCILSKKWKLGMSLPWEAEGVILKSVDIWTVPVYKD